jgi:hypothetical protein
LESHGFFGKPNKALEATCEDARTSVMTLNPKDMPYGKLTILVVLATSIPLLAYLFGGYVHVSTFPYGAYYHSAIASATFISGALLLAGFFGLLVGLVRPALSLWFGERSRRLVLIVYGLVLILGVAVRYEAYFLSKQIFANEEEKMALAYRALVPGALLSDARHSIDGVDSNIRSSFADLSRFNTTTGYPFDVTKTGIEFSYPHSYPKLAVQTRIVAHLSAHLTDPNAVIERLTLLRGSDLQDVKPPMRPEEVRVYKGFFAFDDQVQTFTPCGQGQSFAMNLSPDQRETLEGQHRAVVEGSPERSFAILTGGVGPEPGIFMVQKVYYQSRERSSRCDMNRDKVTGK